jgi:hypothetical protein
MLAELKQKAALEDQSTQPQDPEIDESLAELKRKLNAEQ